MRVASEQLRHVLAEERLDAHLVELRQFDGRRQPARLRRDLRGRLLPHARAGEDSVEPDTAPPPALAEKPRLLFAQRRKAIVVVLERRRLPVTDQIERSHARRTRP